MSGATRDYSIEQQEVLDSGLRMLAQMIAAAHIRRITLRETGKYPVVSQDSREKPSRNAPSENYHE